MSHEREYVLGTADEEIARLGLQHRVWRAQAMAAWRRAGFGPGQHLLDVGSGPGYASLDLADLAGAAGRVTAVDQSRRFLDHLDASAHARGLRNITTVGCDLDGDLLPDVTVDGAWVRWVFAFVRDPRQLLARVRDRLRPGGAIAIHEYFAYATWRMAPPSVELSELVGAVIASWRQTGGEPDIALSLPAWLEELGFTITHINPIVEIAAPGDPKWEWLMAFVASGSRRLAELGELPRARSDAIAASAGRWAGQQLPMRMITPGVLEITAIRR